MTDNNHAKDEIYLAIQKVTEQKQKVSKEAKKSVHVKHESEEEMFITEIGDDD